MNSNEIRRRFIEYFAERGHLQVPSSSLVPHNDPTVLLTTAGMQQMTPYFLGLERPLRNRLTSIQKCFRTVDIDEVGDEQHLTFFEMLGNFSVGDYFKAEAISWAWELMTTGFGIPPEKLSVTVHHTDDFAYRYWQEAIGLRAGRIRRLGDADNWWGPVGATGPNGPDSEIFYDRGIEHGCGKPDCGPGCDCDRFLETWNLVFMEFFKEADGSQRPLPRKNIDTGMGLERISMILQGAGSVFETDLYLPILQRAADVAGVPYRREDAVDRSLRVIADHARAVTFLIGDGVFPGNEGRSYVLRRVLRRAVRHGRLIGLERPFLTQVADTVIEMFSPHYANLGQQMERIRNVIAHEEEHFQRTLSTGIARFESLALDLRGRGEAAIPGTDAFRLYDTYGFPFELTQELAADAGLAVDRAGFDRAMEAQRELSRASARTFANTMRSRAELYASLSGSPTGFLGYDMTEADACVTAILGGEALVETAEAGDQLELALDRTPFYGESGGQVGDTGTVTTDTGVFDVVDTQRPTPQLIIHQGVVREGFIQVGQGAHAAIDAVRRADIRRNHTATHLVHAALRMVLGEHAHQAGSLVAPDRLRFDFTSLEPVGGPALVEIQEIVNEQIALDKLIEVAIMPFQAAAAEGAMALFGEKYGDTVRVVSVTGFSKELCGGTHVSHTGEIGLFVITEESSVASGVRRIEALTGRSSAQYALKLQQTAQRLVRGLHVPLDAIPEQVDQLIERLREREREVDRLRVELASSQLGELLGHAVMLDGVQMLSARVDAPNRDTLLRMGDRLRDQLASGVIVLGAVIDERPALLAMVTKDLVDRGIDAGKLIREITPVVGGRGGGRPELAQGGGTDPERLDDALRAARAVVERALAG